MRPGHGEAAARFRLQQNDLVPALLSVILAGLAFVTPAQNDTFWHLRSGKQMWETGWFLTSERFSHTAFGTPLHNDWWVSQIIFFGVFSLGGPLLLTLFAGACAMAAVIGSWRLMRGPLELRIALLAVVALLTAPEWAIRPQVISLGLIVIAAHAIGRGRQIWLPLLCAVWANAHPMVIFGVAMAGACAVEAAIWSRKHLARDGAITVACAAVPMLVPPSAGYWHQVWDTVNTSRALDLQEYQPATRPEDGLFWLAAAAMAFLVARRWRAIGRLPREDRILLIASGVLALAAVTAARNIAFFAVVAAPAASRLWPSAEGRALRPRAAGALDYGLVGAAIVVAVLLVARQWQDGGVRLGWRPISAGAIAAVDRCPGPLFNSFEDGGYLMWALPRRLVFVDSRINVYPREFLHRSRAADLQGDYATLFRDFHVACALVVRGSPVDGRLRADPSMSLIYADTTRSVFRVGTPPRADD